MHTPDEFDPMIERLFSHSPALADSNDFAAALERRLTKGSRIRTAALSIAGLIGGVIAVREAIGFDFGIRAEAASADTVRRVGGGLDTVAAQAQTSLQSALEQYGVGLGLDLTSMAGMQLFWVATAVLIAAATLATLKLTDQL